LNQQGENVSAENTKKAVAISELPTVSVKSGWRDDLSLAFSCILMLAGVFGVCAAVKTLKQISTQAHWMKVQNRTTRRQLSVTQESVQVVIDKERARIRVEVKENPNLFPTDDESSLNELVYKVFCEGPTPAFIVNAYATLCTADTSDPPKKAFKIPASFPTVLHPDREGIKQSAFIWQVFDEDLGPMLNTHTLFLHFYGMIEYTDVFDKPRFTKFRYIWSIRDSPLFGGYRGVWVKNGSDEDNKAT
jgi:hypothetical protein